MFDILWHNLLLALTTCHSNVGAPLLLCFSAAHKKALAYGKTIQKPDNLLFQNSILYHSVESYRLSNTSFCWESHQLKMAPTEYFFLGGRAYGRA